jgi:hypothetical protein
VQGVGPGGCRGICGTPLDSGLSQGVGYLSCFIYDDIVSFDDILLICCLTRSDMMVDDAG